jgi:hypothetical protein
MGSRLLENYKFPENVNSSLAPDGSCEFVGESLFEGALGRKCGADGLECFSFSKVEVYASCLTRKEALKLKRHR